MDKLLIILEVPSISSQFELELPDFVAIKTLIPRLVRAVRELSGGLYSSSETEFLCARNQNLLMDEDACLKDYDIGNGDHLILM